MKIRKIILLITRLDILFIIIALTIAITIYKEEKENKYTYIIGNSMGISNNCYVNDYDFRICEVKDRLIKVDMFYEEIQTKR